MLSREEHIARLIFLHIQGMTDDAQEKELNEWRAGASSHEALFQRMLSNEHVEKSIFRFVKTEEEEEKGWQRLLGKMKQRGKRIKWLPYVAAVILLLGIGWVYYYSGEEIRLENECPLASNNNEHPGSRAILILPDGRKMDLNDESSRAILAGKEQMISVNDESLSYSTNPSCDSLEIFHTLEVPRGGEYIIMLSDSTVVYLNADSRLIYPVNFLGKERRVYLAGEAYFKVKKDTGRPFIVEAQELEVQVMGTTFGVRAYKEEGDIQTTLESGKVIVRVAGKSVDLIPNKQALFDKSTRELGVRDVDVDLYLAWADGRLVYDNCPLEKILTELGRWYAFDVFYSRDELRSYQFSLNMKKHESFAQVLELIEKTGDIQFDIKNKTVIVK